MSVREFHLKKLEAFGGRWPNFEPRLSKVYLSFLKPGSVVFDGGANIGIHAIQFALAVDSTGLVIAVEPIPDVLERLHRRQIEHQVEDARIRRVCRGLWSCEKTAEFFHVLDPVQHELSGLRFRPAIESMPVQKFEVQLTTIDILCAGLRRLDYVKLDLEGAEMEALRGGRQTIARHRPVVSFEANQDSPRDFGYTWADMLEYWQSLRYRVFDLVGVEYTQAGELAESEVWDYVAVPAGHPLERRMPTFGAF